MTRKSDPSPFPYFQADVPPGTCPHCGGPLGAHPATSRHDNRTPVCSDCGVVEAVMAAGAVLTDAEAAAVIGAARQANRDHSPPYTVEVHLQKQRTSPAPALPPFSLFDPDATLTRPFESRDGSPPSTTTEYEEEHQS